MAEGSPKHIIPHPAANPVVGVLIVRIVPVRVELPIVDIPVERRNRAGIARPHPLDDGTFALALTVFVRKIL